MGSKPIFEKLHILAQSGALCPLARTPPQKSFAMCHFTVTVTLSITLTNLLGAHITHGHRWLKGQGSIKQQQKPNVHSFLTFYIDGIPSHQHQQFNCWQHWPPCIKRCQSNPPFLFF